MSEGVPEGWSAVSLGDICSFGGGSAFKEKYQGSKFGDYPFIKVSDMNLVGNERFISYASNWITKQQKDEAKIKLFPKDSVVFAKVGAALLLNRRRILLRETAIDNNMMAAIPSDSHRDYLYFLLQSISFGDFVQSGAVPSVNQNQLESVPIISPPLPEQKKIAAILTSVDEVIEKTESQINKLQDLKKAMMQTLLTQGIGHTEFKDSPVGRIPREWEVRTLGKLAVQIKPGPFGSSLKKEIYVEKGFRVYGQEQVIAGTLKIGNYYITESKYKEMSAFKVRAGDILVSLVGTFGQVFIVPDEFEEGIINPRLLIIRLDLQKQDPLFVRFQLVSDFVAAQLRKFQQGGTMGVLSATTIKPVILPVPPFSEQKRIAFSLTSLESNIGKKIIKLEKAKALKKSLMQDLLTGKVRVKPE
jgi:type I restriction enzyme, S subunit